MSRERRQVVSLGGTLAALSGVLMPYLHGHPSWTWMWCGVELAVVARMLVLVRRGRKTGCM